MIDSTQMVRLAGFELSGKDRVPKVVKQQIRSAGASRTEPQRTARRATTQSNAPVSD